MSGNPTNQDLRANQTVGNLIQLHNCLPQRYTLQGLQGLKPIEGACVASGPKAPTS